MMANNPESTPSEEHSMPLITSIEPWSDDVHEVVLEVEEFMSTQVVGKGKMTKGSSSKLRTSPRNVTSPRQATKDRLPMGEPTKRPMSATEEAMLIDPISWWPPYFNLRRPSMHMPKTVDVVRYYISMPLIPQVIPFIEDVFGNISLVKFDDYDLENEETFLDLALEYYLDRVLYDDVVKVEPMLWARGLSNAGILNLLNIPHFGRYNITTICVRQLLALVNEGCLWI